MKILIITYSIRDGYGGWARYSAKISAELKKQTSQEVKIAAEDNSGDFALATGKSWRSIVALLKNALVIRKVAKSFDVVHALDVYPYGIIAWLATVGKGKKFFISAIGTYSITPGKNFFLSWLMKKSLRNSQKIFAISRYTAERVRQKFELNNIAVVHLGVENNILSLSSSELNLPENYLLTVGDVKPRKGYHISLTALTAVKKVIPFLKYVIVGYQFNKPYREKLQQIIDDNGLADDVIWFSDIGDDKLAEIYRHASLYIMPSINDGRHFEGFGLSYIEAGLFGVPAIGSKNCGAEDAIIDNQTGYLIEQNNAEILAEKIISILTDEEKKKSMGTAAKKFAENFTWQKAATDYLKNYELE